MFCFGLVFFFGSKGINFLITLLVIQGTLTFKVLTVSFAGEDKMVPLVCGEIAMDMEVHGKFFFNVTCRLQESVYPFKSYKKSVRYFIPLCNLSIQERILSSVLIYTYTMQYYDILKCCKSFSTHEILRDIYCTECYHHTRYVIISLFLRNKRIGKIAMNDSITFFFIFFQFLF